MNRAYSALHVKEVSEDAEFVYIKGIASTPTVDRMGDIVNPMGAQFKTPMPLLWHHRHSEPVGQVTFAKPTKNGIPFEARLPIVKELGILKDRIDEAIHSMKYQLVNFVSIGFSAVEGAVKLLESGGYHFEKWNWLELSLVTIPAQPDAMITAVKSVQEDAEPFSEALITLLKSYDKNLPAAPGTSQIPVVKMLNHSGASDLTKTLPAPEGNTMNIAEQLKAYRETRAAKAAAMLAIMEKSGDAGETLDQAKAAEYDEHKSQLAALDAHIARLTEMDAINLKSAAPVVDNSGMQQRAPVAGSAIAKVQEKLAPGIAFARYAMCLGKAKGDHQKAFKLAEMHYPNTDNVVKLLKAQADGANLAEMLIQKATIPAGSTTDSTWAAPLVYAANFGGDFIEFLRARTLIGQAQFRPIPFNVRVGQQTSGGTAKWVGQGKAKPVTKFDYVAQTTGYTKVAAISVLTQELIRLSDPSAEGSVRDSLADAVIERIDSDLFDPDIAAVTGVNPAGLLNGVAPVAGPADDDPEAIRAALMRLWAAWDSSFMGARPAYYTTPAVARLLSFMRDPLGNVAFQGVTPFGGTLDGIPLRTSQYLANNGGSGGAPFILVDEAEVYLADDGSVTIDASEQATIEMSDTPVGSTVATVTSNGSPFVNMWQNNSVAFRAERWIWWGLRRTGAVQWIDGFLSA